MTPTTPTETTTMNKATQAGYDLAQMLLEKTERNIDTDAEDNDGEIDVDDIKQQAKDDVATHGDVIRDPDIAATNLSDGVRHGGHKRRQTTVAETIDLDAELERQASEKPNRAYQEGRK